MLICALHSAVVQLNAAGSTTVVLPSSACLSAGAVPFCFMREKHVCHLLGFQPPNVSLQTSGTAVFTTEVAHLHSQCGKVHAASTLVPQVSFPTHWYISTCKRHRCKTTVPWCSLRHSSRLHICSEDNLVISPTHMSIQLLKDSLMVESSCCYKGSSRLSTA